MSARACIVALSVLLVCAHGSLRTDQQFWKDLATNELEEALRVKWNLGWAKNVVLFVGDGMGPNTVTATRIYKGGESHRLVFEQFPHIGLLKTYSANKMVPDSACTATALFSGVKTNQDTVGVDASVTYGDCLASLREEARPKSLAAAALDAGKSAGLVTTMRVTHATPGPLYAHSASRNWECEATMPADAQPCKDIARQLVEDWPGKDLHVILGGGRQGLVFNASSSSADPLDTWGCIRQDGRDLINEYRKDKESRELKYSVVSNNRELQSLDVQGTDYLLGIFANGHLKYEHERDHGPEGTPSLSDMVRAAIQVLRKNQKGFFLMVEGGNIDMGHHRGKAKKAVDETSALEDAVRVAAELTDELDTLLIVTSDHTHTLSINGYSDRGANIFGVAERKSSDQRYTPYTTLSYGTGGPGSFQFHAETEENQTVVNRQDPTPETTDSFEYEQVAGIMLSENSHGGGDVTVYARGPYAHLFHNVHEQHYVYHVTTYAARMGPYTSSFDAHTVNITLLFMTLMITYFL